MPIIPIGQEPTNLKKRIDLLFSKLNGVYSNKVIIGLEKDHKKWGETAREISRQLGYENKNEFLTAYGYTLERLENGRPSNDHMAIIEELKHRYPHGAPFEKIGELKNANPDLAGNFKTLANKAKDLFGMSLADYFKSIGLLGGSDHKKQLNDLIAELKNRYPTGSVLPVTLEQLKNENSDLMVNRLALINEIYKVTPLEYLRQVGLIDYLSPVEKLDALIEELKQRYRNKRPAGTLRQLKAENADLPFSGATSWAEHSGVSLIAVLRNAGLVDAQSRIQQAIKQAAQNKPNPADGISFIGYHFVYTHNPMCDDRRDVVGEMIVSRGGRLRSAISRQTDYLIIDHCDEYETQKYIGVKAFIEEGVPIQILTVEEFLKQTAEYDKRVDARERFIIRNDILFRYCGTEPIVTIPDGIRLIGERAFEGNTKIEKVIIPNGVIEIEKSSFQDCTSLGEILIPDTVSEIGANAFAGCENLRAITVPSRVTAIRGGAFQYCTLLSDIFLPDTVSMIGANAFAGCESLRTIMVPSRVSAIQRGTFQCCKSLCEVILPNEVYKIGENAFAECESLKNIKLPQKLTLIGIGAFSGCTSLEKVI